MSSPSEEHRKSALSLDLALVRESPRHDASDVGREILAQALADAEAREREKIKRGLKTYWWDKDGICYYCGRPRCPGYDVLDERGIWCVESAAESAKHCHAGVDGIGGFQDCSSNARDRARALGWRKGIEAAAKIAAAVVMGNRGLPSMGTPANPGAVKAAEVILNAIRALAPPEPKEAQRG